MQTPLQPPSVSALNENQSFAGIEDWSLPGGEETSGHQPPANTHAKAAGLSPLSGDPSSTDTDGMPLKLLQIVNI